MVSAWRRFVDALALVPRYALRALRKNPWFVQPKHIDKLIEGMHRAGPPE